MHTLADLQHAAAELRDTVSNLVSHLVNHPDPTGSATPETIDTIHAEIELSTQSIAQAHNTLVGAGTATAQPAPAPLPDSQPDQQEAQNRTQADPAPLADDSQLTADALNQAELDRLAAEQAEAGPA